MRESARSELKLDPHREPNPAIEAARCSLELLERRAHLAGSGLANELVWEIFLRPAVADGPANLEAITRAVMGSERTVSRALAVLGDEGLAHLDATDAGALVSASITQEGLELLHLVFDC